MTPEEQARIESEERAKFEEEMYRSKVRQQIQEDHYRQKYGSQKDKPSSPSPLLSLARVVFLAVLIFMVLRFFQAC